MKSKEKSHSLRDGEITTERNLSRRSALGALGLGAGATAASLLVSTNQAKATDGEGRGRRCPYRDRDSGDTVRRRCGLTDND